MKVMYGQLTSAAAFALLLSSPGMAATTAPAASPHAKTTPQSTSNMRKETMHHVRGRKVSLISSKFGHDEVRALNALEAAGYRQLKDLHAKGRDFVGTAQKHGNSYNVRVTPSGRIEATWA